MSARRVGVGGGGVAFGVEAVSDDGGVFSVGVIAGEGVVLLEVVPGDGVFFFRVEAVSSDGGVFSLAVVACDGVVLS